MKYIAPEMEMEMLNTGDIMTDSVEKGDLPMDDF